MNPVLRRLILDTGGFNPYLLPNNLAIYSLAGVEGDSTFLTNGSGALKLIADRSPNSATNVLAVNGASGNYASSPDSAAISITGDIDIRVKCALDDWTPSAVSSLVGKWLGAGSNYSYIFQVRQDGTLGFSWCPTGLVGAIIAKVSTVAVSISNYGWLWVRAVLDVDNGAGGNDLRFYTSIDGVTWTQLGATVTTAGTTSIFDGTATLAMAYNLDLTSQNFLGLMERVQIYNGIGGTLAFDANFAAQSKLAASFAESSVNAATVTVNTSGQFGARICGARDLVQLTTANMPTTTVGADGIRIATFDGTNDNMRSAPFSEAQPLTDYLAGSIVTWASGKYLIDGAAAANTAGVVMTSATPQINLNAGSSAAANTGLTVGTRALITSTFSGASSALGVNFKPESTGDAGSGTPNGSLIGCDGAGANFSNMTFCAQIIRSGVDDANTKKRIQAFLMQQFAIAA